MELKNFFAQDNHGEILPGALCYLYVRGTESLANGLKQANGTGLVNPFTADKAGLVQVAAPNGLYDIRVVSERRDYRIPIQFKDVDDDLNAAQTAAARAESARDAAMLTAGVYGTVSEGLLKTPSGNYFSVPAANDSEYLVLYKNAGGTAVETKRYPSAEAVSTVLDTIRPSEGKRVVFAVGDENGYDHFVTKEDGAFGTQQVFMGARSITNDALTIVESEDGAGFSIVDPYGYHAVYIGRGEALRSPAYLQKQVEELKSVVATVGSGAAIPVPRKKIIAHRGTAVSGIAPENSLDAYMLSARAGYTIVETDVLKTADSQYVIMHDDTINRTCRNAADYSVIADSVAVLSTTLADLRANYVLAADNPKHRRKIPKLAEFLAVCRDTGLHPIIELKNTSFTQADVAAIVNMAAEYLGVKGFSVTCFNLSLLDYVRTLYADVPLYYIYSTLDEAAIDHMVAMKPACLNSEMGLYTSAIIAAAHKKGVTCAAWTVGTSNFDKLIKLGLDQFATNTIAPEAGGQSFVYRNYSDTDFAAYQTNGTAANGAVTLLEGQSITFKGRPGVTVGFGAYYVSFDYQGLGSFSGTRISDSLNNSTDDYVAYCNQAVLVNDVLTYTITAGAGGCKIKDIRIAIANL